MVNSLSPPRLPVRREDEPRILAVRGLSWPVSISIPLTSDRKAMVSCVVPRSVLRCPRCGHRQEVA